MAMRLSGLMSGMDTESIIQQLVEAKKTKVTKAVKAQKSLKYKQDAWKDLNKQILNLYNKSLSNMRFQSSFVKKVTKVSNSSVVSVITGEGAMNSVQNLKVDTLAKSGYLTGGKLKVLKDADGNDLYDADGKLIGEAAEVTGKTKLSQLGLDVPSGAEGTLKIKVGGEVGFVTVDGDSTVENFVSALREAGLNANFDEVNQRIYVASKASGSDYNFEIEALDGRGLAAMNVLKLSYDKVNDDGSTSDPVAATITSLKAQYQAVAEWGTDAAKRQAEIDSRANSQAVMLGMSHKTEKDKQKDLLKYADDYLDQDLKDKLAAAGITDIDENFDYDALTDDQKKEFSDAIAEAIERKKGIAANPDATDEEKAEAEKAVAALGTWVSDWQSNSKTLKDLESKLDITEGGTKYDLKQEEKDKIAAQVDKEVDNAKYELEELAKYEALTDAEKNAMKGNKQDAVDAKIYLNGVEYTSSKNTFEINGITLTVNAKPADGEVVTITTEDDTNGVYDMVKNFIKEYNALINQMDKLYNAESSKGYDPLTDEEKEAMSDSAIEEWENKIKDSILRKDSTLSTFANELKKIMMEGVEVNGTKMYLSNFGIGTLNYFLAPENEKSAYHIDGDPDDDNTSGNPDKLKSMIANDPDTVVSFFTQLSQKMYDKMFDLMKSKEGYSSAMTAYDDKKMQTDYDDYTAKIKELEKKLADYEDKWYAKFAAMETALAKMQNNASAVTSLLGGS